MSEQLQLRRGTAAALASFTGAAGEVVVDTTNNRLVVHDGVTAGGIPAAKLSEATSGSGGAPSGAVVMFAGTTAPSGWQLCDGSAISRVANPSLAALAAAAGYSAPWGPGDGATTFNVPNYCSRGPICAGTGSGLSTRALGAVGGEESHTLTLAELAHHTHSDAGHSHVDAGHSHSYTATVSGSTLAAGFGGGTVNASTAAAYANISTSYANISAAGGGSAHNNMHPFFAINFIIKL